MSCGPHSGPSLSASVSIAPLSQLSRGSAGLNNKLIDQGRKEGLVALVDKRGPEGRATIQAAHHQQRQALRLGSLDGPGGLKAPASRI